jgi:3-deoxy-D-manno-octulosonic-acid transferase
LKTRGIYFLYRILQVFGLPAILLYFLGRGFRNRGYWRSLPQRFGRLPRSFRQTAPGSIWFHAVSVGEILACAETLRGLKAGFPNTAFFVSTSTLAGRAIAEQKLGGLADGIFFAPVDYVFAVRRVLRALRPSVLAIAETEIWPNLIREAGRTGAAVTIINARISDRALPRYRRFAWFFRAALAQVDSILAQTEEMRARFIELGAAPERVRAAGNLKYDFEARPAPPDSPVREFLARLSPAKVWVAASTMPPAEPGDPDEDDVVLAASQRIPQEVSDLALVLAPRRPERFETAARKLEALAIPYVRRSALGQTGQAEAPAPPPRVLLLDTIGELSGVFALADAVFMGGTLARRGGHNILEPALFAKPVIAGPHMENFQAIADEFRCAGAYVEIGGPEELAAALARLLKDPAAADAIGRRALACAEARRGAAARVRAELRELHSRGVPVYRPAAPWLALAWPLSRLWEWGGHRRRARALARQRRLGAPVIAVGNLTMGGTGKTPCVLRLAELLLERGHKPGILTRGYGRSSPQKQLAIPRGGPVAPELSGDEPQIFVRSGLAPVGIGGDRFRAGRLLLSQFDVDAFLLDDGFQHARLGRDLDIVLIDGLEPFGRGGVFPLGRLREPESALARADIVLVTRSAQSDLCPAIERTVRRWNARAPLFRATVEPRAWVSHSTGQRYPAGAPPFGRAGAFCGLGNPHAFRRTLEGLGVNVVDWVEFEDHHRYRPEEVRRIGRQFAAHGADALATTEKDAINLSAPAAGLAAPLPVYWLQIAMRIEREDEFIGEVMKRLQCAGRVAD